MGGADRGASPFFSSARGGMASLVLITGYYIDRFGFVKRGGIFFL